MAPAAWPPSPGSASHCRGQATLGQRDAEAPHRCQFPREGTTTPHVRKGTMGDRSTLEDPSPPRISFHAAGEAATPPSSDHGSEHPPDRTTRSLSPAACACNCQCFVKRLGGNQAMETEQATRTWHTRNLAHFGAGRSQGHNQQITPLHGCPRSKLCQKACLGLPSWFWPWSTAAPLRLF